MGRNVRDASRVSCKRARGGQRASAVVAQAKITASAALAALAEFVDPNKAPASLVYLIYMQHSGDSAQQMQLATEYGLDNAKFMSKYNLSADPALDESSSSGRP
jgi:hypothetical protein